MKFVSFGWFFGILLALGSEELWRVQNLCCFLGRFLAFLWLKVAKKHGVPSWVLKFCSVGELSCRGCELEIQCQIAYPSVTGKVQNLQKMNFLGQFCVNFFWHASSTQCLNLKNILHAGGQGRKPTKFWFL